MKHKVNPKTVNRSPEPPRKKIRKTGEGTFSLRNSINRFLEKYLDFFLWIFIGFTVLFAVLLFDPNVSVSGDDAYYIIRASDFIKKLEFPTFQGPLYPMVLSLFVAIGGLNLTLLKSFSMICMAGFIFITHISFRKRVPALLHVVILLIVSVDSFVLHYASQTYSEAFFMLLQAIFILVFFRYFIDKEKENEIVLKEDMKRHFLLGLAILAIFLTKNVGVTALLATSAYFLSRKQWKNFLYGMGSVLILFLIFQVIKFLIWGNFNLSATSQGSGLLRKDFYNPALGNEDLAGFFQRFIKNSGLYISRHFYNMTGIRKYEDVEVVLHSYTIVFYLFFIAGLILSWMKDKYLFFIALLSGIFISVSFIMLQTSWDQERLIIPAFPYLLLTGLASVYLVSTLKKAEPAVLLVPLIGIFMFSQLFATTVKEAKVLSSKTGKYDRFTPDWKHYLQASEWAAKNLPKDAVIACRKASISYIYGNGREFYGIMNVPSANPDLFFKRWKSENIPYRIYLRRELAKTPMEPAMVARIKNSFCAQIAVDTNAYLVYLIPDSIRTEVANYMAKAKLTCITDPDSLSRIARGGTRPPLIVFPDSLLLPLIKNNVTHVIFAQLRQFSYKKDGNIINTVERYMTLITDKYGDFLSPVQKFGADDDESSEIFKLNYEKQKAILSEKNKQPK